MNTPYTNEDFSKFLILLLSCCVSLNLSLKISSNLNSLRGSNDTSLSERIKFRFNSSIEYQPYPPRPVCESLLNVDDTQYPVSVSIWKIDLSDSSIQGLLSWSEEVTTSCTFGFFGAKTTNTLGSIVIPFKETVSMISFEKYFLNPIDEIVEDPVIPWDLKFYCYYCKNDYKGVFERTLYKHVIVSRYPDGSIRSPIGNWGHITKNIYTDGKRYLYISYNSSKFDFCPFRVHEVRYGILSSTTSNTMIISLPSVKQQYSIPEGSDHLNCKINGQNSLLWHTAGGYIISFSGEGIPMSPNVFDLVFMKHNLTRKRRGIVTDIIQTRFQLFNLHPSKRKRSVDPMEFSSNLRSDLVYAQFRFEIDFVLKQINKNLILIQNNICDFLHMKWTTLYPPDLPRKVAQYISHSPFSLGEFKDGIYKITSTVESNLPISLMIPLIRKSGMYQVIDEHQNQTLWAEPITGILFKEHKWTHYSMVASWLPLINGTGIDPLTGRIVCPDTANTPITLIEQTEEYFPQALYTQGSLSGVIEDNAFYNSPATPSGDASLTFSWWSGWMQHIVVGFISIIISIIITPAIMKLLSACVLKGEELMEKTLHLRNNQRSQLIPKDF